MRIESVNTSEQMLSGKQTVEPQVPCAFVSACLLGLSCRYNGERKPNEQMLLLSERMTLIPVCPEQMGGLPTPRLACEIKGGSGMDVLTGKAKVISQDQIDFSAQFVLGAKEVLRLGELFQVKEIYLKAKSPSCGVDQIYDGSFSMMLRKGDGVCAALLKSRGWYIHCVD